MATPNPDQIHFFMAQRAIVSSEQREMEAAAFASLTAADIVRAPIVLRRIPLDLRPLLKPHKAAGRLCLRIERLPQSAKLSAGHRSTDDSWSLASDELDDLYFLISSNVARDYELTVRIMTFVDGEVSTLKVVQFVISASDCAAPVRPGRDSHGQDPVIRSQLSEMHSLFAVRESELIELRAALQHAISEKGTELAKARIDWELGLDRKVAEAVEQSRDRDRQENEAKEAERKSRAAQEKLKAERTATEWEQAKVESERRSQAERQKWLSETAMRMEAARQEWKCEAGLALEAARQAWQGESEERNKIELERCQAECDERIEAERRKWHAQAEGDAAKERDRRKSDADQRLDAARQVWQAEADERRKVELEDWKADTERRIEAEREAWLVQGDKYAKSELEHVRVEFELRVGAEHRNWQIKADEQTKKEHDRWKATTEQRVEAARRASRVEAEAFLVVERTRLDAETEQRIAAERERLLSESAAAAKTESMSVGAQSPAATVDRIEYETIKKLTEERDKNEQLNAALLTAADKSRELEAALAAMTPRCENAERALAKAECRAQAPEFEDGYINSLRSEIATLHKSIASQAAELGRTRAALAQARPLHIQRGLENRPIGNLRDAAVENDRSAGEEKRKGLIRDCIVVSAIIIPLVLFYPSIAVYLPQEVRDGIATATGGLLRVEVVQSAVLHAPLRKSLPPPKSERTTAVASRAMNVHASPGSKGVVVLSLQRKALVVVLGKRGSWTEIEVPAEGVGQPRRGWVWSAYLQDKDG
jgi:hypothetical protein